MEEHLANQRATATQTASPTVSAGLWFVYVAALIASIATWFFAFTAPLWLDETVSYWEISGGFNQIWNRTIEGLYFPAYFYALWATRELLGSREVWLRVPSVVAMLAAILVLYRIARQFFDKEVSLLICTLFCLQKSVAFAAIDVRPYAFAILATNVAIYAFIRWIPDPRTVRSILVGVSSALIFYFQYLYGVILPAFLVFYLVRRGKLIRQDARQLSILFASFLVVFLPLIPRLDYLFSRRNTYSFADPPQLSDLGRSFIPTSFPMLLVVAVALLLALSKFRLPVGEAWKRLLLPFLLAVVPLALLYGVSVATPIRVFIERYTLVGVIGVALLWGGLIAEIRPGLRLTVCLVLVPCAVLWLWFSPEAHRHGYSWKPALEYAQRSALPDQAPILICSDLPQSDFLPMPTGLPIDSILFASLSYYKVTVPVIPLPRALNDQAKNIGRQFVLQAAVKHQRFLALGYGPSYPTLRWLLNLASATHQTHEVGEFEGVAVLEFVPKQSP